MLTQGLYDIVNNLTSEIDTKNNNNKTYAQNTSYAIYNKLLSTLGNRTVSLGDVTVYVSDIFNAVFASEADMITKLPNMEVKIDIATCDYYENKAQYADDKDENGEYDYPLDKLNNNKNPIIFWGLDAYGPNASSLK